MKITYEIMKWYKLFQWFMRFSMGTAPMEEGAAQATLGARRYGPGHGTITYEKLFSG